MTNKQFLLQLLCKVTNANDIDKLLTDILTPAEYQDIAKRLEILSLAKQSKTAWEISKIAWVWLSTAQRWVKVYNDGSGICSKIL